MESSHSPKERILCRSAALFHTQGFRATSLQQLLDSAKVTKGTLYHHFSGKDALGLAVLDRAKSDFLATLDDVFANRSPGQGLAAFLDLVLKMHRGKGFVGGCLFGNTALEMSDADSRYAESVEQLFRMWVGRFETVIQAAQEQGELREDISPRNLAVMMVATIEGGIMLARLQKKEGPLKACLDGLKTFLGLNTK